MEAPKTEDNGSNKPRNRKALSVLFLSVFIDLIGFGIIIPVLPYWNEVLGGTIFTYGAILSIYSLMQFVFAPIWGRISDKRGRRPIILIGIAGSIISFFLLAFTYTLAMLIIARALQGIFTSATLPTAQAFVSDTTTGEERAKGFGLIGAAFGLGIAVGPAIGGGLYSLTGLYSSLAYFASGVSALNLIFALIFLPETLKSKIEENHGLEKKAMSRRDSLRYLLANKEVLAIILTFSMLTLAFSSYTSTLLPYGIAKFGLTEENASIVLLIVGIISVITQGVLLRFLTRKYSNSTLMVVGFTIIAIGLVAFSQVATLLWMILVSALIALGSSMGNPTNQALLSQKTPDDQQGGILGINQGLASLMRVFAPLIGTALLDVQLGLPFFFGGGLLVLAILFFVVTVKNRKTKPVDKKSVEVIAPFIAEKLD
ncbi:MAG: MFS transporter [Candidatus Heimdallarchaeota archaeon]|nr:MFS transporter [Candidatus Heimdallarchaeota archaeon]